MYKRKGERNDDPIKKKHSAMTIKKTEKAKKSKDSSKTPKLHEEVNAILGNPKIFSPRAMAMSIYMTLCVLVSSSLDPLISFISHHRGAAVYLLPHSQ